MEGVDANPPESRTMVDRISDLPDHVAHHIPSFLTITHLASFECVLKRCQQLCLSSPSLNFDGFSIPKGSREQRRLVDCLDRFLFRRGDNKIKCFRVRWFDHSVRPSFFRPRIFGFAPVYVRTLSWIRNAVSCNVEELDIHIHIPRERIEFPSSVFLSGSLKSLSADLNCMVLHVPSSEFSSNLKFLELREGRIEEGFFKWISCCCNCIEKLVLKDLIVETITIESSSLKTLYIDGDDSLRILNISGQKLENIHICWSAGEVEILKENL